MGGRWRWALRRRAPNPSGGYQALRHRAMDLQLPRFSFQPPSAFLHPSTWPTHRFLPGAPHLGQRTCGTCSTCNPTSSTSGTRSACCNCGTCSTCGTCGPRAPRRSVPPPGVSVPLLGVSVPPLGESLNWVQPGVGSTTMKQSLPPGWGLGGAKPRNETQWGPYPGPLPSAKTGK